MCKTSWLLLLLAANVSIVASSGLNKSSTLQERTPSLPPSIIGIGVQKAGSTTLYAYMKELPWIGTALRHLCPLTMVSSSCARQKQVRRKCVPAVNSHTS